MSGSNWGSEGEARWLQALQSCQGPVLWLRECTPEPSPGSCPCRGDLFLKYRPAGICLRVLVAVGALASPAREDGEAV